MHCRSGRGSDRGLETGQQHHAEGAELPTGSQAPTSTAHREGLAALPLPQSFKQMAIAAGIDKVFEIGYIFRAEPSFTSRRATEFTGVDEELAWIMFTRPGSKSRGRVTACGRGGRRSRAAAGGLRDQ